MAWPRDGAIIFRDLIGKLQIQAQSSLKRLTIRLEIHDALASPPVRSRSAITRPSQIDQLRARETQPGLAVIGSIVTSRTSPCDWGEPSGQGAPSYDAADCFLKRFAAHSSWRASSADAAIAQGEWRDLP